MCKYVGAGKIVTCARNCTQVNVPEAQCACLGDYNEVTSEAATFRAQGSLGNLKRNMNFTSVSLEGLWEELKVSQGSEQFVHHRAEGGLTSFVGRY